MSSFRIQSMTVQTELQDGEVDPLSGRERLAQELHQRDAGDFLRVLEGKEHSGFAPSLRRPAGDVLALV